MLPDKEVRCHLTGFKKSCRKLVETGQCKRWMAIRGMNPNTGEPMDEHRCIDDWIPLLLIENSQMQRQTGASVDKVATEIAVRARQAQITRQVEDAIEADFEEIKKLK